MVFAKRGRTEILGRGVVAGSYEYDADGGHYPHVRAVEWDAKGSWHMDEMLAMKTLTDVTDYRSTSTCRSSKSQPSSTR